MDDGDSSPCISQNLRRLIALVDELRDIGLQQYVNLPRICVVGTQSAGKSSVLEAIVGLDFLPRGDGVVTRRPLELRLIHESSTSNEPNKSWAYFEAKGQKIYTNFQEVKTVIEELTDEVAGKNKGIVDDPIVLTVHSTNCPDLTLIDLPGITRVPLKGSDQTDDIERLTRDMAMRYARDLRTIILAVVPANIDMSTSDALQIARKVDPKGLRTIGVITKIDLMDKGTDASRMLLGEEVPLRLGYTGVRNRSQADIINKVSISEAIQEEKRFFLNHMTYRSLPPYILGTQALIDKLTRVLFRHIRAHLPEIKREISNRLRGVQQRLDELGSGVPLQSQERIQLMWSMITDYCELFRNTIRGKFDKKVQIYFEHQEMTSGAQIRSIFNDLLEQNVRTSVTAEMQDYDIDLAIRMHEGDALPGFPSSDTFEYLILPHFHKIQAPVMDCLDRVAQALESLSQIIILRVFNRFPKLSEQIMEKSSLILLREKEETKSILENVVAAETGYLFTNDSSYLTNHGSMLPMQDKARDMTGYTNNDDTPNTAFNNENTGNAQSSSHSNSTLSNLSMTTGAVIQNVVSSTFRTSSGQDKKKTHYSSAFIKEIRERLDAYFNIVLRNIRDIVPKIVGFFLVRRLQEKLQFELYNDLAKAEHLSALLGEPKHIVEERVALQAQMATLKKAAHVLQRDPISIASPANEFDEFFDQDLAEVIPGNEALNQQNKMQHQMNVNGPGQVSPRHQMIETGVPYMAKANAPLQQNVAGAPQMATATSSLWGAKPSSKPSSDRKLVKLFGERTARNDSNTSKIFVDAKVSSACFTRDIVFILNLRLSILFILNVIAIIM